MKRLGLDISTKFVGYAVSESGNLKDYGYIDLSSTKGLIEKSKVLIDSVDEIFKKHEICEVLIEAPLKHFAAGKSSADSIIKLCNINFIIQYNIAIRHKQAVFLVPASTARKRLGIHVPQKEKDKKKLIVDWVARKYYLEFPKKRTGRHKNFAEDICDAIVVACCGIDLTECTQAL